MVLDGQGLARTRVGTDRPAELLDALSGSGVSSTQVDATTLEIAGLDARTIAQRGLDRGILIHELTPLQASLEEAYMELTKNDVEYHSGAPAAMAAATSGKQA
jgi:ABC-2 type transport system ATP-binding protein